MSEPARPPDPGSPFRLLDWTVEPSLNRLRRGDETIRLEPKMMDVLRYLAEHPGQVHSKDQIADAVWPDLFITESVVTRAISGLRRAFGDEARAPRFIETIAKRGYRLLPRPVGDSPARPTQPSPVAPPPRSGQWVRGEHFFGREHHIAEALHGPRAGLWILGGRYAGKTSFLKHLEYLCRSEASDAVPVFLDLQGIEGEEELHGAFHDALADAAPRFEPLELKPQDLEGRDIYSALGKTRRALRTRGKMLLLLLDEAEELVPIYRKTPAVLRKLRRALQAQEGLRTVLAASAQLWQLTEQRDTTSPFLHGFAPPLYLGPLTPEAAQRLLEGLIPSTLQSGDLVAEIFRQTGRHPWLLRVLAERLTAGADLETAQSTALIDPTVQFFFSVEFDLLTPPEQAVARWLAEPPAERSDDDLLASPVHQAARLHLEGLGWVENGPDDQSRIASRWFEAWLRTASI